MSEVSKLCSGRCVGGLCCSNNGLSVTMCKSFTQALRRETADGLENHLVTRRDIPEMGSKICCSNHSISLIIQ